MTALFGVAMFQGAIRLPPRQLVPLLWIVPCQGVGIALAHGVEK